MAFSIRDFFAPFTLGILGAAAIVRGTPISWAALVVLSCFVTFRIVDAFVAKERRRTFAIGLTILALVYGVVVFSAGRDELEHSNGRLPTTRFLQAQLQPSQFDARGFRDQSRDAERRINAKSVMPAGHLTFAILFGYLGGIYALRTRYGGALKDAIRSDGA